MAGVVIGGAGVALTTASDIIVSGVVYRGSTLNWITGLILGPGLTLNLSAATIASTAATGTVIGSFSVTNGTGVYTYSLTSNPGNLFNVVGTSLVSSTSPLTPGLDPITGKADNGAGSIVSAPFLITVSGSVAGLPSLDFSNGTLNSQNLMVVMGI